MNRNSSLSSSPFSSGESTPKIGNRIQIDYDDEDGAISSNYVDKLPPPNPVLQFELDNIQFNSAFQLEN